MRKIMRGVGVVLTLFGGMSLDSEGNAAYVAAILCLTGLSLLFLTEKKQEPPARSHKVRW